MSATPELKRRLSQAGCRLVRQGKGDHEIRTFAITDKRFPVDSVIKSRHTANAVLSLQETERLSAKITLGSLTATQEALLEI